MYLGTECRDHTCLLVVGIHNAVRSPMPNQAVHLCMGPYSAGKSAPAKAAAAKQPTAGSGKAAGGDEEGQVPIILSGTRRADISTFKGRTFVNIREYYEVRPFC
jgi:hypothetical protein